MRIRAAKAENVFSLASFFEAHISHDSFENAKASSPFFFRRGESLFVRSRLQARPLIAEDQLDALVGSKEL
jgi:hypothetical protein